MAHDNLKNYFETNFALYKHHGMQISEIENMLPWEKDAYLILLIQWVESEKVKLEQELRSRGNR